jgi:cytidylate kinase
LREKGLDANLKSLVEEINARDSRDAQRTVAPLQPAVDAEVLDTTQMNIKEVCEWAWQRLTQRLSLQENR